MLQVSFAGEVTAGLHSLRDVKWSGRPFQLWFKPGSATKPGSIPQLPL